MASQNALSDGSLPVMVPEPDVAAPPSLAEPASGPAAAIPGAETSATAEDQPTSDSAEPTVNGSAEQPPLDSTADGPAATSTEPATDVPAAAAETAATETASQDAAATAADDPAADTNGTPAAKKASSEKRKSTSVPEHKGKKLIKKKSMAKITHLDAKPGEHYFARLKSYPPWPAIVCDEDILPISLRNTRPVTTKKADGSYNEPYADGGKKVNERTFAVMFLGTNEFAWIPNTDLSDLDPTSCKDASEKGKTKALIAAYAKAAENNGLDHYKEMLLEHTQAMEDEAAKQAAKYVKKPKAEKKKRKSDAKGKTADDDDVEMEEVDDAEEVKKSSKKRKKAADSDDEGAEKPAKTPKTTKLKLTTRTPGPADKEKKPAKKNVRRKSKAAVDDDEDMADAPEEEAPKPLDPAAEKKAREKEVLFFRHKLQKGFLSRDQAPQEEDMPHMSQYIKKLEDYEELEVSIIRTTKINKVLKALIKLNTIPRDEEFNFRKRSLDLLGKWSKILGSEPQDNDTKGDAEKETAKSTPATNGVHDEAQEDKKDEKPDETAPAAEPEPEPASTTADATDESRPAEPETARVTTEEKPVGAPIAAAPTAEDVESEAPNAASAEPPATTNKAAE